MTKHDLMMEILVLESIIKVYHDNYGSESPEVMTKMALKKSYEMLLLDILNEESRLFLESIRSGIKITV